MNDEPEGLDAGQLVGAASDGWGVDVRSIEYLPVGFGSYHWGITDRRGDQHFVTVDDLGLEDDVQNSAYRSLSRAFGTALALHRDAGLEFVVAPVPDRDGNPARRLDARYAVSVFPYVDGDAGPFGPHPPGDRDAVLAMLVRLHEATPTVAPAAPGAELSVPGREGLQDALDRLDEPWAGGPYSEPARRLLAARARRVEAMLADVDRLGDEAGEAADGWVVTHGEPHPGNVLRSPAGLKLVDWDMVRIAPPERDLWMVADGPDDELAAYADATGRPVSRAALAFYRLSWDLADIAVYLDEFRRPHRATADAVASWWCLNGHLAGAPPPE